jgi:flagellar basal-body rod protein FlgC
MPVITVDKIRPDTGEFQRRFEPNHPAADAQGYVLAPNVNSLVEMMDMREASRSYEANLSAIRTARTMMQGTIDILR